MAKEKNDSCYFEYIENLGIELRRIRHLQSLSIAKVSEISGIHRNTINAAENGKSDISLVSIARIMATLASTDFEVQENNFHFIIDEKLKCPYIENVLKLHDSEIVYMTGNTIREHRITNGLTIETLSEKTSIHKNTIWNIENGLVNPTVYNLFKIHKNLGIRKMRGNSEGLNVLVKE